MILKTRVKNKKNVERVLRWAGIKGVSIGPKQEIDLNGGYPTACRNAACVKQMESEIASNLIEVSIVTDLDIVSLNKKKVKKEVVGVVEQVTPPPSVKEEVKEKEKDVSNSLFKVDDVEYNKGPMERFLDDNIKTVKLDGKDQVTPGDHEIFKEATPIFKDGTNTGTTVGDSVFNEAGEATPVTENSIFRKIEDPRAPTSKSEVAKPKKTRKTSTRKPRTRKTTKTATKE
jgi:hypothetical protein